ncbi:MAG: radical SAM protein [Sandaracinaceae bacterium]|nr:radical SAM protein [Sandaracinaceae bacterium]
MAKSPRVALVSIDPVWEDPSGDFTPFTYGVRKLEASILSDPTLSDVEVRVIDLRTRDPEAFFEAVVDFGPTLVGASTYLWSIGPFRDLAARIKRWDPSVQVIVGGPQARPSVLALEPYREMARTVDAAVTVEGEGVIRDLARGHLDPGWRSTPGLLVPHALGWRATEAAPRVDIEAYPTPYQIDAAPKGYTGYLETFRGCPIHCNFCQWGEQRADRVHSAEYLASHLEGLKRAEVPNIFCLDAAFNLSPRAFRALAEAERQVGVLKDCLVHGHLYPTFLRDEHIELLTSFKRCQVAIGVQSFDAEVLHRLGRPFDLDRFEHVCDVVRQHWPIELELMLGLPGDTPASFRRTFERAVEIADSVRVFWTLVLPDALLDRSDPSLHVKFDPNTWLIESCAGWSPEDLRRELDHVKRVSMQHENAVVADHWAGFQVRRRPEQVAGPRTIDTDVDRAVAALDPEVVESIRQRVGDLGGWRLRTVRNQSDGLFFDLDSPEGKVVLEAVPLVADRPRFEARDGVAYSHRGEVSHDEVARLRRIIEVVHPDALPLVSRAS